MLAQQEKLLDFLGNPDAHYSIPLYQRAYSWDTAQCEELWSDLLVAASKNKAHFAGSLLYLPAEESEGSFHIIDGQQRCVTVSLLLLALSQYLEDRNESLAGIDGPGIRDTFLSYQGHRKMTLSPIDNTTFEALIAGNPLPEHASKRVITNFKAFADLMEHNDFDPQNLWRGLRLLSCITVQLTQEDNPQVIFEDFNARGERLTTADMVRNYLLLPLDYERQVHLYENYWEPMHGLFGDDPGSIRLNNAILGWLSVRSPRHRAMRDRQAFSVFKRYLKENYDGPVEDLLDELYSFCMVWAENYRYHATKKYRAANWAKIGKKTLVSDRPLKPVSKETLEYYSKHFGTAAHW